MSPQETPAPEVGLAPPPEVASQARVDLPASRGRRLSDAVGWPLLVIAITSGFTAVCLRLWVADMRLPFTHRGDELFSLMVIKDTIDHGWFLTNPDLGAPLGQHLYDFAGVNGDSLNVLIIKLLGFFTDNPSLIQNVMFVLSFPAIALVTFLVLRSLDISEPPAAVVAILFALAPYHFTRGESHLFLSLYYAVPLGGYLTLCVFGGRPLFRRRAGTGGWLSWASGRTLGTVLICVVVASSGVYYAIFSVLLVLAATAARLITTRRWASLLPGCAALVVVGVVMLANQAPTLLYQSEHGSNDLVAQRTPYESDIYSLKLARLVLPVPGHRIDALSDLTDRYLTSAAPSSSTGEIVALDPRGLGTSEPLGLVATIGFVWLLVVLLLSVAGPRPALLRDERHGHAAFAATLCLLLGTTGGLSALIATFASSQIRGWNRISIVIAFFAFFGVALLLDLLVRRVGPGRNRQALVLMALGGVLLAGVYDQTNRYFVPPYSVTKAEYGSDRTFVAAIERQMPRGADIFQLPYMPFPGNGPVASLPDQDLLRPYVQSHDLRWSYASMKGRPEDWVDDFFGVTPEQLPAVRGPVASGRPLGDDVAALVAAGFDGIYIDRFGYPDSAAALEAQLQQVAGSAPIVSPSGRSSFISLLGFQRRLAQRLSAPQRSALAQATLHPVVATFGPGFYPLEPAGTGVARWALRSAQLVIDNPGAAAAAVFTGLATTPARRRSQISFRLPGGTVIRRAAGEQLRLRFPLRHGRNVIVVSTDAPQTPSPGDPRMLFMRFKNPRLVDPARAPGDQG